MNWRAVGEKRPCSECQSFKEFGTRTHRADAEGDASNKFAIRFSKSEILLCVPARDFVLSGVEGLGPLRLNDPAKISLPENLLYFAIAPRNAAAMKRNAFLRFRASPHSRAGGPARKARYCAGTC